MFKFPQGYLSRAFWLLSWPASLATLPSAGGPADHFKLTAPQSLTQTHISAAHHSGHSAPSQSRPKHHAPVTARHEKPEPYTAHELSQMATPAVYTDAYFREEMEKRCDAIEVQLTMEDSEFFIPTYQRFTIWDEMKPHLPELRRLKQTDSAAYEAAFSAFFEKFMPHPAPINPQEFPLIKI